MRVTGLVVTLSVRPVSDQITVHGPVPAVNVARIIADPPQMLVLPLTITMIGGDELTDRPISPGAYSSSVVHCPSWPELLAPHDQIVPSDLIARLWLFPAATAATLLITCCGVICGSLSL